jgi:hypothetical protein
MLDCGSQSDTIHPFNKPSNLRQCGWNEPWINGSKIARNHCHADSKRLPGITTPEAIENQARKKFPLSSTQVLLFPTGANKLGSMLQNHFLQRASIAKKPDTAMAVEPGKPDKSPRLLTSQRMILVDIFHVILAKC